MLFLPIFARVGLWLILDIDLNLYWIPYAADDDSAGDDRDHGIVQVNWFALSVARNIQAG
jgi:hypothetical protein